MEIVMTYALNAREFAPSIRDPRTAARNSPASGPGILRRLLRRLVQAMIESRRGQVDREIAAFLARSGGRLTDDMERRITEHLLGRNWKE
jgi:hypothetical protein